MAITDASQGALAKLYVKDAGDSTFDEPYEFIGESIQATQAVMDTDGIRGERAAPNERTRLGVRTVNGTIVMNPSPDDLDKWLPRVLGAAKSGTTYPLGDSFTAFDVYVNRVAGTFKYTNCLVNRALFRAQPGGFLEMTLDIIGQDEEKNPSVSLSGTPTFGQPYVFHDSDSVLEVPADTVAEAFDVEVVIDNAMSPRFVNSVTLTAIKPSNRIITYGVTVPWIDSMVAKYRPATRGGGAELKFLNSNTSKSLRFLFTSLDGPDISPVVGGKVEIGLRLDYRARRTAGTDYELSIVSLI